jgi:CotH kinase protein
MQLLATLLIAFSLIFSARAQAQNWVEVFNPVQVLTLNLELDPVHWDTIRHDTTNELEFPAQFWAHGEETPLLVSVRRKSSRALPSETSPIKVGLKVDLNEYVSGQTWRGLTKLSLENGGDKDPISEGFAWNLHEMATGDGFYPTGYHPGQAAWVRLVVNGQYIGLYTSVEERDSQFLRNRGLPRGTTSMGERRSWLYEIDDRGAGSFELEDGSLPHGPTWTKLCYAPFTVGNKKNPPCATPNDATLAIELPELIDMSVMLTQAAVEPSLPMAMRYSRMEKTSAISILIPSSPSMPVAKDCI